MKVISLINMKGGVGKTTISVNIADCLSRRESAKVLLIDIDPQFNSTQCLLRPEQYIQHLRDREDTIINVFDRSARPQVGVMDGIREKKPKNLKDIKPIEIKRNLYLLPGSLELYRVEMIPGEGRENRLNKYLQAIDDEYKFDYVIIDTPPTPSIWMTSALLASQYYLIPVKPDPLSFTGIDLLQSIIDDKKENLDLKIECCGLLLTMVEKETLVYREAIAFLNESRWGKYKFKSELPKKTAIARNQLNKTFILDLNDATAKSSISSITSELISKIK